MSCVPTKVGFPSGRAVLSSYRDSIRFPLSGSAPLSLWNHKLGFGSEVIRRYPPTASRRIVDGLASRIPSLYKNGLLESIEKAPLERRAFNLSRIESSSLPQPILWSEDMVLSLFSGKPDPQILYSHADSHSIVFIHRLVGGPGKLRTDFGVLDFKEGDFLYIPRGVTYSIECHQIEALLYEFLSCIMRPYHYWIEGYPFPSSAITPAVPEDRRLQDFMQEKFLVLVKRHLGVPTVLEYPFSPFEVVAWEGDIYPFALRLSDICALSSPQFHINPKAFTIFVTEDDRSSLQVFLPRWVYSYPYPHQNYCTEVLLNHRGYAARQYCGDGFLTIHPPGLFHGPDIRLKNDPDATEPNLWKEGIALMLESSSPFLVLPALWPTEKVGYENSWSENYRSLNS